MANNYGEFIGVSQLHIAEITADTAAAYTPGTISYLAPAASVAVEPQVATKNRYYDNKAYFSTVTEAETKVTLAISGIDLETKAKLLGKYYDTTAKKLYDAGDAKDAPYFALGFKTDVEGGARYYWFLKGKFEPYKEEGETVGTDIAEKTTELVFTAIVTTHEFTVNSTTKGLKSVQGDNRLDTTLTDTGWFTTIPTPTT